MSNPQRLDCRNIAFERDDVPLFDGVDFKLGQSEVVQVTGPNGTGKTTLLRILSTSLLPSSGEVLWRGVDIQRQLPVYRSEFLYLGHGSGVKPSLTPLENLKWFFHLFPCTNTDFVSALQRVSLQGYENVPCHTLSAGQQRRVALARLYLTSAALWILDEPFTSIDVHGVSLLEELMSQHLAEGGSILVTTHQKLGLENVQILNLESFAVVD